MLWCLGVTGLGQDRASLLSSFETAKTLFNSADQSQALTQLSQIIEAASLVSDPGQMDPEVLEICVKSLEMRGLVYYGSGDQDKATAD
jgi:hypothetical protein